MQEQIEETFIFLDKTYSRGRGYREPRCARFSQNSLPKMGRSGSSPCRARCVPRRPLLILKQQLFAGSIVQAGEELLLDLSEGLLEFVEFFGCVLVVHEEPVVELEGVVLGVAHEVQEGVEALRVDWPRLEAHAPKHPAHRGRDELGAGGLAVVVLAGHWHHVAALLAEEVQEGLGHPLPLFTLPNTLL